MNSCKPLGPKWLPEARPISKKGRHLSVQFIVSVLSGQAFREPMVESSFALRLLLKSEPVAPTRPPRATAPRQSTQAIIGMVHGWAHELTRDPKLRLADLARRHGFTRARVTQLMPLASLDEALVAETLRVRPSTSIRFFLRLTRSNKG